MANSEERVIYARVISQRGTCVAGHKQGDEFLITDMCPAGMCAWAFYTLFPFAQVLMSDGTFPWEKDADKCTVACPDPGSPVVFELSRKK
ncbi:MAG: TIGR04076 family protein [Dehalococcoidia bacterium]|nr:TIGR04076 family protein [Dehalococcoidia bacterium]